MVVVVIPGREPDRRDAKILQIRQAIDDTLKIAAVVVKLVLAIVDAARLWRVVVCRIAIAEPVEHDQIHYVRGGESLEAAGATQWRENFEGSVGYGER